MSLFDSLGTTEALAEPGAYLGSAEHFRRRLVGDNQSPQSSPCHS